MKTLTKTINKINTLPKQDKEMFFVGVTMCAVAITGLFTLLSAIN